IEQANFALWSFELVFLFDGCPRHSPTLGGQRVTGVGQLLLLHEQSLARSLPFLRRHHFRCFRLFIFLHVFPFSSLSVDVFVRLICDEWASDSRTSDFSLWRSAG